MKKHIGLSGLMVLLAGCSGTMTVASAPAALTQAVQPEPRTLPPARASALVGEKPDAVQAALGQPELRHPEGPAEVWLYATAEGCRIDVVLYRDSAGSRVAHADARMPRNMSEAACLQAIAERPS